MTADEILTAFWRVMAGGIRVRWTPDAVAGMREDLAVTLMRWRVLR